MDLPGLGSPRGQGAVFCGTISLSGDIPMRRLGDLTKARGHPIAFVLLLSSRYNPERGLWPPGGSHD
jgi:hypothetical protein